MIRKYVHIVGDTNDADWAHSFKQINDGEMGAIKNMAKAISQFKPYIGYKDEKPCLPFHSNFPTGDHCNSEAGEKNPIQLYVDTGLCSMEDFDTFEYFLPREAVHTIVSIEIIECEAPVELLEI